MVLGRIGTSFTYRWEAYLSLRRVSYNIYGRSLKIHTRDASDLEGSGPVLPERHSFGAKVADMADVGNVWRLRVVGPASPLSQRT